MTPLDPPRPVWAPPRPPLAGGVPRPFGRPLAPPRAGIPLPPVRCSGGKPAASRSFSCFLLSDSPAALYLWPTLCEYGNARVLPANIPFCYKVTRCIHNLVQFFPSPEIVLQRNRSLWRGDDINVLLLCPSSVQFHQLSDASWKRTINLPDPRSKFVGIRNRGRKQDDVDVFWQHDDDFLPDNTTLSQTCQPSHCIPTCVSLTSASFT